MKQSMGLGLSRLLILTLCACSAACMGARAQAPLEDQIPHAKLPDAHLPDAPVPISNLDSTAEVGAVSRGGARAKERQPAVPARLSAREKYGLAYRRILSLQTPVKTAFVSGFELAAGTGPDLATNGWSAFAKRLGDNGLNLCSTIFFDTALIPSLAHQDPRYPVLGHGPAKTRVAWAVRHEFVGFSDDGRAMPNYGNIIGLGLASITANAYSPEGSRGYGDTAQSYLIKLAVGTGLNVVREFKLQDHLKTLMHHSKADSQ